MDITSWTFAGFVAAVGGVYYFLPRRAQNMWLLLASYVFYVTWSWQFALVLAAVTMLNLLLARALQRDGKGRPAVLWAGIALNILVLAIFKYAGFFVAQATAFLTVIGLALPGDSLKILLPVGLSFTVLQTISYLVDVYRGQIAPTSDLVDFGLFLAYFPKLISGPIERARSFLPLLAKPRVVNNETLGRSGALIAIGLVRKIVFANVLARTIPEAIFTNPLAANIGGPTLFSWLIFYGVYLYNDFAGYTSIVRGVSLLFGIELSPNFQTPFFARNFTKFWNQWHISLSQWLRDYIFFPVSRTLLRRNNNARFLPNVIVPPITTMLVSGLWHGATPNLLLWGLLHGIYQAVERIQGAWRPVVPPDKQPVWRQALGMGVVFVLAMLAWVPFRSTLPAAFQFYQGLLTWGLGLTGVNWHLCIIVLPALWLDFAQARYKDELFVRRWPKLGQAAALAGTALLVVMASAGSRPPFVYQGF